MLRFVALCHFLWGLMVLTAAAWFVVSSLRVLPHMSTGSVYTNVPAVMLVAASAAGPPAALGVWMLVLGRMAWIRARSVRSALLWTHGVLLLVGLVVCAAGFVALKAAALSAERGGGILGSIAALPLLVGVPMVLLALCSIAVAVGVRPV